MKTNNRTEIRSIRIRKDILEIATDMKNKYDYSLADIFEMGVLMIDNNQETELILQDKILSEMLAQFSKLELDIRKNYDDIQKNISEQINRLVESKSVISDNLDSRGLTKTEEKTRKIIQSIVDVINVRRENYRVGLGCEPMGREFFEFKSKVSGIPTEVLLCELWKEGFSEDDLLEVGINPRQRVIGEKESVEALQ